MPTVKQKATAAVFGWSIHPTKNYQSYKSIRVWSNKQYSYIYFNRPFPLGATIVSATLQIEQDMIATGGNRTITVRQASKSWKLSTLTFNNKPAATGPTASAMLGNGPKHRVWSLDVSAHMQAVANGGAWWGFYLSADLATELRFYDHGSSAYGPRLTVEYVTIPAQPAGLAPSNGGAVSLARPTLVFGAVDTLTSIQVQMNKTVDTFTAPTFDSGEVASTVPQFPLPFDVAAGDVWFWRVRVKNDSGIWSVWSGSEGFTRLAKVQPVITSPAASPNNIVYDPTPPFAWTFAATQTIYRALVWNLDTGALLWDSKTVASDDSGVTYPTTAPKLQKLVNYQFELRVNDDQDRVTTPGDATWVRARQNFTFALSNTVTPATSLSATSLPGDPRPTLSWTRTAGTADQWLVFRDDILVASIDGTDLPAVGGQFVWADLEVASGSYTYSVAAVVNNVSSAVNPAASVIVTVEGVWLMTLDGECAVSMWGDAPEIDGQEISTVHLPLGATNPVLITQAVFGRKGQATNAYLKTTNSRSLSGEVAVWNAIDDRETYPRGTPMQMAWSDTSMTVFIFNAFRDAEAEFIQSIPVSFEFCELL